MYFDESLFEDFQNNTKAKIKQCSYQARNIEMGWFLTNSENETYNEAQTTDILRQKADYFYAQCDYGKALEYYGKLLQSISATNKMLCYEVKESMIRCLRKMNKNTEVLKIIDEMSEDNKMDSSLWLLLFNVHKDKNNTKGAIFALQCCLEHHEEIADYWIKLARSYNHLSTCFKLDDLCMVGSACCLNDNQKAEYEKDLSLDWYGMQHHDPKDTWVVTPTDTTKSTSYTTMSTADTTKPTTATTKPTAATTTKPSATTTKPTAATIKPTAAATTKPTAPSTKPTAPSTKPTAATIKPTAPSTKPTAPSTKQINEMTLDNKEVTGPMEEKHAMLQPDCITSVVALSPEQTNLDEMKHYVQEHYYCFCTLCSLIIARFLLRKFSFHSSELQSKKENENFVKVTSMIKSIRCVSVDIIKDTERLVNEKFAISSVSTCTPAHSNATNKSTGILAQDEMIQRIKDFEKQWFPFL